MDGAVVTDKLDEMWAALEALQPTADANGYGELWRQMCERRHWRSAISVAATLDKDFPNEREASWAAWAASDAAKAQADEDARIARPALLAQRAIDAIKEVKPCELLELAAKAAGMDSLWRGDEDGLSWNPLTDDGDALRLAVKLFDGDDMEVIWHNARRLRAERPELDEVAAIRRP